MTASAVPLDTLARVRDIVAVHSAKGGVGKSTVASNLAAAAARLGLRVGLLDADIHGPSVAHLFGSSEAPKPSPTPERVLPIVRHGVRYLSLANVASPSAPIIWRGPMVSGALSQMLSLVDWGELDLLLVDMPPGTGDAMLGLGQAVSFSGVIVVTTPQELALADTRRGVQAFGALSVPPLGLVENLSSFTCDACGDTVALFGESRGPETAERWGMPFLARIPIDPRIARASDDGVPIAADATSALAGIYESALRTVLAQLSLRPDVAGSFRVEWKARVPRQLAPPAGARPVEGAAPHEPAHVWQADHDLLAVAWADGRVTYHGAYALRMACPCAACVEEWTRSKSPSLDAVPKDVRPVSIRSVGRYALLPVWSDGHQTGIFSFTELRRGAGRVDAETRQPTQE